jgi:predicted nuclease of predicted toxin-antitoxin system
MTYFVDVNLPKNFSELHSFRFVFVHDYSASLPDNEVWDIALKNDYVILTRDKDFYYRALQLNTIPKIVLFRLGNCNNQVLFDTFLKLAPDIEQLLLSHRLLVLWPSEIQVII